MIALIMVLDSGFKWHDKKNNEIEVKLSFFLLLWLVVRFNIATVAYLSVWELFIAVF